MLEQLIIESARCQGIFPFSDFGHMPMNMYSIAPNNRVRKEEKTLQFHGDFKSNAETVKMWHVDPVESK